MKKPIAVVLVVVAVACAMYVLKVRIRGPVALDPPAGQPAVPCIRPDPNAFAQAEPNQAVFDLTYRGLSGPKDKAFSLSLWSFGGSEPRPDPAFIKALKDKGIGPLHLVYNPYLKGAEWSALEMRRKRPVAFYFDLDADGKITANERLTPAAPRDKDTTNFVTPDFFLTTQEGDKVPFRAMLEAEWYNEGSTLGCSWSGACLLEGQGTLEGQPARLVLYPYGPTGIYDGYGRSMYGLAVGQDPGKMERATLSSLILYDGLFYRLQVQSKPDRQAVRVVVSKDTSPRGRLAVGMVCDKDQDTRLSSGRITDRRADVYLSLQQDQEELPIGKYRLENGRFTYGSGEASWQCDFQKGPEFEIVASQETKVRLGEPKLTVKAVPEDKRYEQDVKTESVYAKGTRIYITREIQGMAGEAYGRFSRKGDRQWYEDVKPQIRITGPDGKEVVSKDMEYG